jgi:ferredoxin-NADP reductase
VSKRLLIKSVVTKIDRPTASVTFLHFAPVHRSQFPLYKAGAHTVVRLHDGMMRPYSLCGDPPQSEWRIAVHGRNTPGSVSHRITNDIAEGDYLYLSYPQEKFGLAVTAARHRFIAGGIGITPILAMLYALHHDSSIVTPRLHYFARSRSDCLFLDELEQLNVDVHLHYSTDQGRPDVRDVANEPESGEHLYYCGPPTMMEALDQTAHAWRGRVHSEGFTAKQGLGLGSWGSDFEVALTNAGRRISVGSDETTLQALLKAGIRIDYACEGGICGTCVVDVDVDNPADVDHRDHCLTEQERTTTMAPCVSRGRGTIRLRL